MSVFGATEYIIAMAAYVCLSHLPSLSHLPRLDHGTALSLRSRPLSCPKLLYFASHSPSTHRFNASTRTKTDAATKPSCTAQKPQESSSAAQNLLIGGNSRPWLPLRALFQILTSRRNGLAGALCRRNRNATIELNAMATGLQEIFARVADSWFTGGKAASKLSVWLVSLGISFALMATISMDSNAFVLTPNRKLQGDELATVQLFQENTPSVVYITNLAARRDAFTLDILEVPQGSGSGFLWDKDGHVVTNYHVIRGASDLRVTLGDQSTYEAEVVGFDRDKDVAVLHIDAPKSKLRPIPVGSSADLLVGQKVYAIGNPFGLDHTLTTGVISGLRREISSAATGRPIQDVIQTDAAINPGNSGGPLLDSSGNLIGINTAIYSPSGASAGVGFSIPVDTVSGIVDQLVKYGKVTRPVLGITFAPEQSVEQLGVSGVLVLDAPPTGPAGKAGLKATTRDPYGRLVLGDIITNINGEKVKNGSDLYRILDHCKVGDQVTVEVLRGNRTEKLPVTLESRSD